MNDQVAIFVPLAIESFMNNDMNKKCWKIIYHDWYFHRSASNRYDRETHCISARLPIYNYRTCITNKLLTLISIPAGRPTLCLRNSPPHLTWMPDAPRPVHLPRPHLYITLTLGCISKPAVGRGDSPKWRQQNHVVVYVTTKAGEKFFTPRHFRTTPMHSKKKTSTVFRTKRSTRVSSI